MLRCLIALLAALLSTPALSEGDEIDRVPAQAVIGRSYLGENTPSQIRFINVRSRPVRLIWVSFEGGERDYAQLNEGQELVQPTFIAHRWLIRDAGDGTPLHAFISTRSAARDNGIAQIALIR
jgi:hypothetical protein